MSHSLEKTTVGFDVVGVERVARLVDENLGILDRVYSPREQEHCLRGPRPHHRLAGRFAAKEAVLKALGTGLAPRMRWTDVEVVDDSMRCPSVVLHGEVASAAARRGLASLDVSLSETSGHVAASALGVWRGRRCAST